MSQEKEGTHIDKDFLKCFTIACIKAVEKERFSVSEDKFVVDADLIPKLSEQLSREYTINEDLLQRLKQLERIDFLEPPKRVNLPIQNRSQSVQTAKNEQPQKQQQAPQKIPSDEVKMGNGYLKIKPYMDDHKVSRIQCIKPNKPIVIIREGQKKVTKTVLNDGEVKDVFSYLSELEHIPLIDGPVKINSKEFSIEGMNSKVAGSRFVIKKKSAYAMLEDKKGMRKTPPRNLKRR